VPNTPDQILSVAQMRAAEQALIDSGSTVEDLMQLAGRGVADWVWRVAAGHSVTVLCGPGNNGGDGYVIAEAIRERGGEVAVIAATEPRSIAAKQAAEHYLGKVLGPDTARSGEVLVDCLFGSGLTRPLQTDHVELLKRLATSHRHRIAVDVPSGVQSDTGALLGEDLPHYDLTLALGAWKFAHTLMPAAATMGALKLVPIGIEAHEGAARLLVKPLLRAPAPDAHKYTRGLLAVIGGEMPGAGVLAATAAQRAGAGYVKLLTKAVEPSKATTPAQAEPVEAHAIPPELVTVSQPLEQALHDPRIAAILIGPGLGRDQAAKDRLAEVLKHSTPLVIDADALMLIESAQLAERSSRIIATPHEGEFKTLEKEFGMPAIGSKPERALLLAQESRMVIVAKGPDTVIAAPDGRIAFASSASSWLSTAGTGDVLAGTIASRLATGADAFTAACEGVWLHGQAARLAGAAFTAGDLAAAIPAALADCL
jgi:hydroxyethylthiazole kinase-like uncharacterized protein yjeF